LHIEIDLKVIFCTSNRPEQTHFHKTERSRLPS